ncbi:hypothetical protein T11_2102 [Trichinella zimbabwensis]|uniref:Uncharacterized protein n=1 Tax=Trichinella zimbabwensis TaxID=268475 RepID=A0A0V1HTD2_9BILA|nr:hypothetical protein T11_2102 [Trichinella zimbabwensis]
METGDQKTRTTMNHVYFSTAIKDEALEWEHTYFNINLKQVEPLQLNSVESSVRIYRTWKRRMPRKRSRADNGYVLWTTVAKYSAINKFVHRVDVEKCSKRRKHVTTTCCCCTVISNAASVALLFLLELCSSCLVICGVVCHVHGRCMKSDQARHVKENHPDKLMDQRKECSLRRGESNSKCPDGGDPFADPRYLKRHVQRMHRQVEPLQLNSVESSVRIYRTWKRRMPRKRSRADNGYVLWTTVARYSAINKFVHRVDVAKCSKRRKHVTTTSCWRTVISNAASVALLFLLALCNSCLVICGVVCYVHGRWFVMAKNLNHCSVASSILNVFYQTQKRPQDH